MVVAGPRSVSCRRTGLVSVQSARYGVGASRLLILHLLLMKSKYATWQASKRRRKDQTASFRLFHRTSDPKLRGRPGQHVPQLACPRSLLSARILQVLARRKMNSPDKYHSKFNELANAGPQIHYSTQAIEHSEVPRVNSQPL